MQQIQFDPGLTSISPASKNSCRGFMTEGVTQVSKMDTPSHDAGCVHCTGFVPSLRDDHLQDTGVNQFGIPSIERS